MTSLNRRVVRQALVDAMLAANAARCERAAIDSLQADLGVSERLARQLWSNLRDWKLIESLRVKENAVWRAAIDMDLHCYREGKLTVVAVFGRHTPAFQY